MRRYGSQKERDANHIPNGILVAMRFNGCKEPLRRIIDGKYRFRFTDGAVEVIDTAGAGVVESTPIGLLRGFTAEGVD